MLALSLLAANALFLIAGFFILWLICLKMRDVTPVDSVWALGMVTLAATSFIITGPPSTRKWLLLGLCAAWGLRLGGYMLWRWRDHGPDRRYQALIGKAQRDKGWGFAKATGLLVFATQAPLLFIVCLPVQLGQVGAPTPLGLLAYVGIILAVVGILFETIGDAQLVRFKRDPENAGKVMDRGLWRYTRHPNYFGDACVWWGLFLIAAETPYGIFALPGPILLTWTLMKWSGAPTVEGRLHKTRPGYADYVKRTSGFIPMPPKKS
jgi:steroid 5-alpha reductase family enzyme